MATSAVMLAAGLLLIAASMADAQTTVHTSRRRALLKKDKPAPPTLTGEDYGTGEAPQIAPNPPKAGKAITSGPGATQAVNYYNTFYPYSQSDLWQETRTFLNNPYVCKYGSEIAGSNIEVTTLHLPPCNWITTHAHATSHEFNAMLKGSLKYWVITQNGTILNGTIPHGAYSIMPQGLTHVLLNPTCEITTQVHIFQTAMNPDFEWVIRYGIQTMPDSYFRDTFNMSKSEFPHASIPDRIHTINKSCMKKCGLPLDYFETVAQPLCDVMKNTQYTVDVASYTAMPAGTAFDPYAAAGISQFGNETTPGGPGGY